MRDRSICAPPPLNRAARVCLRRLSNTRLENLWNRRARCLECRMRSACVMMMMMMMMGMSLFWGARCCDVRGKGGRAPAIPRPCRSLSYLPLSTSRSLRPSENRYIR